MAATRTPDGRPAYGLGTQLADVALQTLNEEPLAEAADDRFRYSVSQR